MRVDLDILHRRVQFNNNVHMYTADRRQHGHTQRHAQRHTQKGAQGHTQKHRDTDKSTGWHSPLHPPAV
jgi:hypothetical protein